MVDRSFRAIFFLLYIVRYRSWSDDDVATKFLFRRLTSALGMGVSTEYVQAKVFDLAFYEKLLLEPGKYGAVTFLPK